MLVQTFRRQKPSTPFLFKDEGPILVRVGFGTNAGGGRIE
ncbi:uncharacterized protein G2W53_008326 [Senna tora]|uniref:Uncharacterized protein n=1 Tax=Senna tora TaxID=362788 RepID=A0A834X7Z9_9FABA|nr:uncharacterized protein G2W53_008326 [Senna tora]